MPSDGFAVERPPRSGETGPEPDGASPPFRHVPPKRGFIGPFGGRQIVAGLLVVVLAGVLIVVATTPLGEAGGVGRAAPQATAFVLDASQQGLQAGQAAPELAVRRADGSTFQLADLDGRPVRLADLRGKAVWLNFWASWCPPCQAETPILRDTYEAYRDRGLVIVGVAVQETTVDDVRRYTQTYGIEYPVAFDTSGDILRLYQVGALPTQVFIDPRGVVRQTLVGPVTRASAPVYAESILPAGGGSPSPAVSSPAASSPAASPAAP